MKKIFALLLTLTLSTEGSVADDLKRPIVSVNANTKPASGNYRIIECYDVNGELPTHLIPNKDSIKEDFSFLNRHDLIVTFREDIDSQYEFSAVELKREDLDGNSISDDEKKILCRREKGITVTYLPGNLITRADFVEASRSGKAMEVIEYMENERNDDLRITTIEYSKNKHLYGVIEYYYDGYPAFYVSFGENPKKRKFIEKVSETYSREAYCQNQVSQFDLETNKLMSTAFYKIKTNECKRSYEEIYNLNDGSMKAISFPRDECPGICRMFSSNEYTIERTGLIREAERIPKYRYCIDHYGLDIESGNELIEAAIVTIKAGINYGLVSRKEMNDQNKKALEYDQYMALNYSPGFKKRRLKNLCESFDKLIHGHIYMQKNSKYEDPY